MEEVDIPRGYWDVLLELSNDPKSKLGDFTYLGDVSNLLI